MENNSALMQARKTKEVYGFLWSEEDAFKPPKSYHFNKMQEVIPEKIVRGKLGIDIGSGCGYDTNIMAKDNPAVKIISMDISDGVRINLKMNNNLSNVHVVNGSIIDAPLKEETFDFAYSFGVLHHTSDPGKCISEIARILKKQSPVFLYLYEDHSENILKYLVLKGVILLRKITVNMPPSLLYFLSLLGSPFIFLLFSCPAMILRRFKITEGIAENMPFNFGTSFFSLRADLYDRFAAPIERRFSRRELYDMLNSHNFSDINITKLKATAGWVAWAYKNA